MTDREAELESALKKLWGSHVEPYLLDPKYGDKFMVIDRELRRLGVLPQPTVKA